jgi:uncharacterized protein (DUF433 family)
VGRVEGPGRIEINPRSMPGKPAIRGTRIPAEPVLRKLGEGATEAESPDASRRLTREDIRATLACAAAVVAREASAES